MTGNNPTDRSKLSHAKRYILTDKNGIPLSAIVTSVSIHDVKLVTKVILIMQVSNNLCLPHLQ
jgi:hypothetical protein